MCFSDNYLNNRQSGKSYSKLFSLFLVVIAEGGGHVFHGDEIVIDDIHSYHHTDKLSHLADIDIA